MKLKVSIAFFLCGLTCLVSNAQPYTSDGGRFSVDQIKGCAPLTVNITTINAPYVCNRSVPLARCFMRTRRMPGFEQLNFNYTYDTPGTFDLIVLFQGGLGTDQITITVLPNTPPAFEIYSCGNNSVQVKVTDTNYNQYVINYNDGSPDVVVPSGSMAFSSHTYASSGNKTITVRGRNLGADDNCTPASKVVNAVVTLPVPTITQLTVLNDRDIQLDFNSLPNILYRLQIAQNSATAFQNLQNVYETTTTTINNLSTDGNFYCFRLGAFDPCNNTTVYSNTICSSNFDVTALNNLNQLTWVTSSTGVSNYTFSKNSAPPLNARGHCYIPLNDPNVTCGVDYCYQQTTNYPTEAEAFPFQNALRLFRPTSPPLSKTFRQSSVPAMMMSNFGGPRILHLSQQPILSQNP